MQIRYQPLDNYNSPGLQQPKGDFGQKVVHLGLHQVINIHRPFSNYLESNQVFGEQAKPEASFEKQ